MKPPILRPQRILITGDRDYDNPMLLEQVLRRHLHPDRDTVIHGDARGADRMAAEIAQGFGVPKERILAYPADWDKYHRAAGHIRNQQMLAEGKPTLVLAFHHDLAKSKGTKDMVRRALKEGLPVYLNGEKITLLNVA